jgi:hypothetical protein
MSTNSSYTVTPANNHCSSQTNTIIQQQQGSQNYNSQQSVDTTAKQQTANEKDLDQDIVQKKNVLFYSERRNMFLMNLLILRTINIFQK